MLKHNFILVFHLAMLLKYFFHIWRKVSRAEFWRKTVTRANAKKCTLKDEFFITLTKLKLGLINQDIAYRTNLSTSKVSEIFHRWLDIMYKELRQLIAWPERERLYETLPTGFKTPFSLKSHY